MANPNRASMREGPLAALFRKTEEPGAETRRARRASSRGARRSRPRRAPPRERAPAPRAERLAGPAEEQTHIPTPQERLRHAFSSEIPENIMDRPATHAGGPSTHARSRPRGARRSPGSPSSASSASAVPGVNAVNRMVEAEVEGIEFLADQHRPAVAAAVRPPTSRCTSARS